MKKEILATEVVTGVQERLNDVVSELDHLEISFGKALFALNEIMELLDTKYPETEKEVYNLHVTQEKIDVLVGIAVDYIYETKTCISDIVLRERQTLHESIEGRQEIKNGVPEIPSRDI